MLTNSAIAAWGGGKIHGQQQGAARGKGKSVSNQEKVQKQVN